MALSVNDCAKQLPRARNIAACLKAVGTEKTTDFTYLEIGTCFKEDEGMSTYVAAQFLAEQDLSGHVYSLELDLEHISASREIVRRHNEHLMDRVTWVQGNSAQTVPETLSQIESVDVAFVDGGGHPLFNLFEFQLLWDKLSPDGLILIDDCVYLPPSPGYMGRRDYGKAQLILPFLMLAEYINFQPAAIGADIGQPANSPETLERVLAAAPMTEFTRGLFAHAEFRDIAATFEDMDFSFLAGNQLVVGKQEPMRQLRDGNDKSTISLSYTP
ncbi:MAG: class I SAM-dependent methyltransferase [Pseudomonadota bacterium]